MVIYEVSLEVDSQIYQAYLDWLKKIHIPEVLESPGFLKAELLFQPETSALNSPVIRSLYYVDSQESLKNYLEKRAPALRASGVERWGDRFKAQRQVWTNSVTFHSE